MPKDNRKFPDISFVDTNAENLTNKLIQSYEKITNRKLYPADPTRLFILWMADIIIQERVITDESAKQNVPRYAENEYLDSLAEIFKDAERLQAKAANTTLRFYISAALPSAQIVPKGTRVTVDGEITFETVRNLHIPPGERFGDVSAVCTATGTAGNGFLPRQITQIVDVFPFFQGVENITTSEGGADRETNAAFYMRMRENMETWSTAGPEGAYVYHAKTASAKITDVVACSPEPGIVDIRVMLENGELPDVEMIQLVYESLSADKTRPLTDFVVVSAPETVSFDIDITYYIQKNNEYSAELIQSEIEKALGGYIKWQTEKMGRDINPDELVYFLKKAGVKRIEIRQPEYTAIAGNAVAVVDGKNIIYGGIENE